MQTAVSPGEFRRYAAPGVLGMIGISCYILADTFFVAKGTGSLGLAALNIAIPAYNLMNGLGLMVGVGGATHYSLCRAQGDAVEADRTFTHTLLLGLCIALLFVLTGTFGVVPLSRLLGANAETLDMTAVYLRLLLCFAPFFVTNNVMIAFVRNDGEPGRAMAGMIAGSLFNIVFDWVFIFPCGLGMFGAALATLIAQGISAVLSLLLFLRRMRRYKSAFHRFDGQELCSMLQIAVPSVLQQSTVSIGMMLVQAVVNPFGTQALAGYAATMRVENVFSLIFVSIGNAVSPYVSQNLGAGKKQRIKKGYHAALLLDVCFAVLAFLVIETLHTQISSLFLGKDGTALAYQVSGDYMRWLGFFFIFMGIKMATDGVLRGLGIMRPFLAANMVNLAIRLSVALICAPRFGIAFVWLAVPAGWLANFLISYAALRRSWPAEKTVSFR